MRRACRAFSWRSSSRRTSCAPQSGIETHSCLDDPAQFPLSLIHSQYDATSISHSVWPISKNSEPRPAWNSALMLLFTITLLPCWNGYCILIVMNADRILEIYGWAAGRDNSICVKKTEGWNFTLTRQWINCIYKVKSLIPSTKALTVLYFSETINFRFVFLIKILTSRNCLKIIMALFVNILVRDKSFILCCQRECHLKFCCVWIRLISFAEPLWHILIIQTSHWNSKNCQATIWLFCGLQLFVWQSRL